MLDFFDPFFFFAVDSSSNFFSSSDISFSWDFIRLSLFLSRLVEDNDNSGLIVKA